MKCNYKFQPVQLYDILEDTATTCFMFEMIPVPPRIISKFINVANVALISNGFDIQIVNIPTPTYHGNTMYFDVCMSNSKVYALTLSTE
jgi:hypothetical protein